VANVTEAWEPVSEVEHRMSSVLRSGDQEAYFRLLAQAELLVPVPPDQVEEVLANHAQPSWPTSEADGRTHVLAYTSPEAMRACLGPRFQHFMKLKFGDIAGAWPDNRWWLAVDAGLPIQGHLPSWFVRQLADGDSRPPQAGIGFARTPAAEPPPWEAPAHAESFEPDALQPTGQSPARPADQVADRPVVPPAAPEPAVAQHGVPRSPGGPLSPGVPQPSSLPESPGAPQSPGVAAESAGSPLFPAPQTPGVAPASAEPAPQPPGIPQSPAPEPLAAQSPGDFLAPGVPQPPGGAQSPDLPQSPGVPPAAGPEPAAASPGVPQSPEVPPPASEPVAAPVAAPVAFQPSGEVEHELLEAGARGDNDAYMKALLGAEVLVPIPADFDTGVESGPHPGRPGFPWQPAEAEGRTTVTMFTSVERLREALGNAEFARYPFPAVIRHWPDPAWSLSVNPGTPVGLALPGEQLAGLAEWSDQQGAQRVAQHFEPQNDMEERLYDAVTRRDMESFFKILLSGQVLVPAEAETSWGTKPDDPDFPWLTVPVRDRPSIMAFTSLKWMHDAIGQARFVMPEVLDLVSAWADPGWTFVLNPGTPIDATVPGDQVRELAGPPTQAPSPEFEPGNRIDQELFEAAEADDTDAFLRVLFAANVLVPISADAPLEVTPTEPEFRWDAAMRDESSVQVFTSLVRLREALAGSEASSRFVYTDFRELIRYWPRAEWTMLLNPGTRIGASLRGDQVHALSEWSTRVGLMRPAAQPEPRPQQEPQQEQEQEQEQPLPAPAGPVAAAPPRPGGADRSGPPIMQKVLPTAHVAWYLEQGYDRVGGFVHPSSDVGELQTPAQIYQALGLLYEGSPFSLDDEGVYVMRWPAYCEDLYRIPFGGQSEEELRGWGDSGWVLERAPFLGTGFASGSGGTIREYKVDSARLPYGAELYYLGRDRTERFVAMYDPDRLAWVQPEPVEGQ
jgi:hypothetical protein